MTEGPMKARGMHLVLGLAALVALFAVGATSACSSVTCQDDLSCPATSDGGGDGRTADRQPPTDGGSDSHRDAPKDVRSESSKDGPSKDGTTCKAAAAPADGGCVTDMSGVFVATTGMDATG